MFGQVFNKLPGIELTQFMGAPGLLETPSRSEYLGTHIAQGFERTTVARGMEENAILSAEEQEGTADMDYRRTVASLASVGVTPESLDLRHAHAMSEESWKASEWYREGMQYRPDMTETRARIMAENYDERRYQELVVSAGDAVYGLGMRALGFGATMVGSLADPINFVGFTGGVGAGRAAIAAAARAGGGSAAVRTGALAGLKTGMAEGVAGNVVADALTLPDLKARGEDVGFATLLMDTVFGAALGGALGAAGGGLVGYMGARRLRQVDELARRVAEQEERALQQRLAHAAEFESLDSDWLSRAAPIAEFEGLDNNWLSRAGQDVTEPVHLREEELATLLEEEFALPRNDDADVARAGLSGRDRRDLFRAQERALADVQAGRPVDVGPVLRESQALAHAYDVVRDNPLGGKPDDVLAVLSSPEFERILVERGPAIERDGQIVVQGRELKRATGSHRGYGMVKIIFGHGEGGNKRPDMPPVVREDVVSMPRFIREWEAIETLDHREWRIPRQDGNHLVISVRKRNDTNNSRLVSMYIGSADKEASKRKARTESSSTYPGGGRDTDQRLTTSSSDGQNGLPDSTLPTGRPNVNFAVERQEVFPPAPEPGRVNEAEMVAQRDAELEAQVRELEESGQLDEESAAMLAEARDMEERAAQYDELGQGVLECVWNIGA